MYLDNAATTQVSKEVVQTMKESIKFYGNPSSIHQPGIDAQKLIHEARISVAKHINADPESIIFTSGGSESNTLAITGMAKYLKSINKTCIITSPIEHQSVLESCERMNSNGFLVIKAHCCNKSGKISVYDIVDQIRYFKDRVGLVSIMSVNNEIGTIQDISEIGKICRENGIIFHTDCVQGIDTIDIDVEEMCIDMLSISGHKIHAPKGVGALYVRNKEILNSVILGGSQEFGLRAGTENVIGINSLATAIKNIDKSRVLYNNVKEEFVKHISALFNNSDYKMFFNAYSDENKSKIVSLRFPGINAQTLLLMLSSKGIYVSAGSACKALSDKPSHVLKAIDLSDEDAFSTIRVSFSKYNTVEEVKIAAEIIFQCVSLLQNFKGGN